MPPDAADPEALKVMLPQFGLPGGERVIYRDLIYEHRFFTPDRPDGRVIALLHGTGGDETDLMPLAHKALPDATLLGLRGRSTETGSRRWFRSFGPAIFDQKDIRFEAGALDAFFDEARGAYGLDEDKLAALGYSNGANLLGAAMLLHPGMVRRAVLLRPAMVLDQAPETRLDGVAVLIVLGERDAFRTEGERLAVVLRKAGAGVDVQTVPGGHDLGERDALEISAWLAPNRL